MRKGILIKYGEIVLKGNNRAQFENVLIKDIHIALRGMGESAIRKEQGRLYIALPDEIQPGPSAEEWIREACEKLQYVFGILKICPVDVLEDDSIEVVSKAMAAYVRREFDSACTFKVICKRANKRYPMNSMEVAAEVGAVVLDENPAWKVDVHEPQVLLYVELRNQVYIYGKELDGPGGLPVGTGGKATLLLSGGIDSPVAGWKMARRGIRLNAVYFHAHPYTTDRARDKVLELARIMSRYAGPIPVYVIPFTEIQLAIYEKCHHEKLTIIMRRMMMLIAQ
ncbi:MAG: tRNA 4-thiouridine(8) synthase ThiI, partial [Firmicutes bacterium]|nr:tRNA 4-thiouridine(8) synthase ThiI [Bacillota bacterium]